MPIKERLREVESRDGRVWLAALAANPKLITDDETLKKGINTIKNELKMNE